MNIPEFEDHEKPILVLPWMYDDRLARIFRVRGFRVLLRDFLSWMKIMPDDWNDFLAREQEILNVRTATLQSVQAQYEEWEQSAVFDAVVEYFSSRKPWPLLPLMRKAGRREPLYLCYSSPEIPQEFRDFGYAGGFVDPPNVEFLLKFREELAARIPHRSVPSRYRRHPSSGG